MAHEADMISVLDEMPAGADVTMPDGETHAAQEGETHLVVAGGAVTFVAYANGAWHGTALAPLE